MLIEGEIISVDDENGDQKKGEYRDQEKQERQEKKTHGFVLYLIFHVEGGVY